MASVRSYTLTINGIKESIDGFNVLLNQLERLQQRLDAVAAKGVGAKADKGVSTELSAQEKLQQQILTNEDKIAMARDEDYQIILKQKKLLKDITTEQKATTAEARLTNNEYQNTMQGLKQRLADIKAVMQVTDLNDTDAFQRMTTEANELNAKLLEVEKSYGQFGRQVGNYAIAGEKTFERFTIEVNGTVREFNSAKQALTELRKESDTLRAMGKDVGDLDDKVKELDSTLKDLKRSSLVLDHMLDTLQSFSALASLGEGFKSVFGIDNQALDEGLKKLLALQNILQGVETINMQIKQKEGLGKYFASISSGVDKATASMLAYNKSLLGTGTASKVASVGIKAIGAALKAIPVMAAIWAVTELVEWLGKLGKKKEDVDALKESLDAVGQAGLEAFSKGEGKIRMFQAKMKAVQGDTKAEKALVDELNSSLGGRIGRYENIEKWQQALIRLAPMFIQQLKSEAEMEALAVEYGKVRTEQMKKEQELQELIANPEYATLMGGQRRLTSAYKNRREELANEVNQGTEALKKLDKQMEEVGAQAVKISTEIAKVAASIGTINEDTVEKGTSAATKAYQAAYEDLIRRRINNMKDGLQKILFQLQIEENQELDKIKEGEYLKGERQLEIQREYQNKRINAIKDFSKKAQEAIGEAARYENKATLEAISNDLRQEEQDWEATLNTFRSDAMKSYSDINKVMAPTSAKDMFERIFGIELNDENIDLLKNYISLLDEYSTKLGQFNAEKELLGEDDETVISYGKDLEKVKKQIDDFTNQYEVLQKAVENPELVRTYLENFYTNQDDFIKGLRNRLDFMIKYFDDEQKLREEHIDRLKELKLEELRIEEEKNLPEDQRKKYQDALAEREKYLDDINEARESELAVEKDRYNRQEINLEEYLKKCNKIIIKYGNEEVRINESLDKILLENDREYELKRQEIIDNAEKEKIEARAEANRKTIDEMQSTYNKLTDTVQQAENGMLDPNAIKAANDEIVQLFIDLRQRLLDIDYLGSAGKLAVEEAEQMKSELTRIINDVLLLMNRLQTVGTSKSSDGIDYKKELARIGTALAQELQDVMASMDELELYYIEKEMDALDKQNEILEEKLSEQEEIVEKHKDAIDDIENDLETARGDRRDHLVDALNEEIAAQRKAAAEQKRIEQEQKALEAQQEQLDKRRKKVQYEANLKQMAMSGLLSIANAFATMPFIPTGLALGLARTAAVAVMMAQAQEMKPYGEGGQLDGGVAQGKRHRDGGIPVLGGRASIEGGEYITNRVSTANNLEVLSFINSKKKRLNLDDFIEFYNKPKAVIRQLSPRFEDGGQLGDLDIAGQLKDTILVQSQQPIYVAVTELEDKMNHLNNVRAIAGVR